VEELLRIARALGDESRVRALAVLRGGALSLSEIAFVLDRAPSTVSKHMAILEAAGLVESRRDRKERLYWLPVLVGFGASKRALAWAFATLGCVKSSSEDAARAARARARLTQR
jgi:DNA-binding transcriptional ArsR family regulator